ncbi:MAG: universal stress protein [Ignavibacteriaceae bacterium]|jgi:nucleotide-binding universal stress UspA family protein
MYKKILLAYDGSDGSKTALITAAELTKQTNARLQAIWIKSKLPHYPETVSEIEEEKAAAETFLAGLEKELMEYSKQYDIAIPLYSVAGNPSKILVSYAKEQNFDLIVMGNQGHSGLWGGSLGHTVDRVSEHAHCSILIVRQ